MNDCAGVLDGTSTVDACGTCDADPSNDCVADCEGVFGGSAALDACGTCDADPSNDCAATAVNLEFTTDLYPGESSWDIIRQSDNEVIGGGTFGAALTTTTESLAIMEDGEYCFNIYDSYQDGGLSAVITVGEREPVIVDFSGSVASPQTYCFTIGIDCNGVDGGPASLDECGVCDEDRTNDCAQDCNGVWGGTAVADACGTCDDNPANDCATFPVEFTFTTDGYPEESAWDLTDSDDLLVDSNFFLESDTTTSVTLELAPGSYCLNIYDSFGDGGLSATVSVDGAGPVSVEFGDDLALASYCFQVGVVEDCAGVLGGDARADECGVCDNDPTNDCVQDCRGVFGGDAQDCGNVTVWLNCDDNLDQVRWGIFDELGTYLYQGAPEAMSMSYIPLDFQLEPGTYYFYMADSAGDGGCGAEVRIDGEFWLDFYANEYSRVGVVTLDILEMQPNTP